MWVADHTAYSSHINEWRERSLFGSRDTTGFPDFPSFHEWMGRPRGFPDASTLLKTYSKAYFANGSAGETSKDKWRTRELQSVTTDKAVSIDHTFDAAKAFNDPELNQVISLRPC